MNELRQEHADIVEQFLTTTKANNYSFMLTIARDGESPARSIYNFSDALTASEAYNRYQDWGFAKDYLTVRLYEPNGKIQEKIIRRPPAGDCSFKRADYDKMSALILGLKNLLDQELYKNFVTDVALVFSQDNPRFDEQRFFDDTQSGIVKE